MKNVRALPRDVAVVALSLVIAAALWFVKHDAETSPVITTGASQWHHTTLSDGTTLHVDAHSTVKVEYTQDARIVHVDRGSAVFEVASDPKRPFIARTHLVDVTAVGTRFGVSIHPGVTTTVSEGIVKVTPRRTHGMGTGIRLSAGEELRVPEGRTGQSSHAKVDAERKLEWATGWLAFEGETIGEVIHELNRRNTVQIELEHPDIAARRLGGLQRFRVDSSASYARYIAETNNLDLIEERDGSVLRLRPKAK